MVASPWQLCRQCCCRYGFFPVLVLPIVTCGCLLSLYTSASCKFVNMVIGFPPANEGWDATPPYYFGPLYYYNSAVQYDSMYRESLHGGCVAYSDEMHEDYIDGDRTFKMIQVMTLISVISSGLAMVVAWLFVISPIPMGFLWSAVLLPSSMVAFIAEGSKFLLFDTSLCRSAMWYQGSLLVPEQAESCSMGQSAWFACAAGVIHFWALVCVCLKTPEQKKYETSDQPFDKNRDVDIRIDERGDTSDDPDLEGGDEHSISDEKNSNNKSEEANSMVPVAVAEGVNQEATTSAFDFGDMDIQQHCDATELTMGARAMIDTSGMEAGGCCSPLSMVNEGSTNNNPDAVIVPDIPSRGNDGGLSPVDCIMEGFDAATDLSQIDVCQSMVWSPTKTAEPKTLEDGAAEIHKGVPDEAQMKPANVEEDTPILPELKEIPPIPEVRTTFLRLAESKEAQNQRTLQEECPSPSSTELPQVTNNEGARTIENSITL